MDQIQDSRSPWKSSEDELFLSLFEKHGRNWKPLANEFNSLTNTGCTYTGYLCMSHYRVLNKRKWSPQEDELLKRLAEQPISTKGNKIQFGPIAERLRGRDTKQCRDRYNDYLDPALDKSQFTDKEIELLLEGMLLNKTFFEILVDFPTKRSAIMLKNLWNRKTLQNAIENVTTDRNHLVAKRQHSSLDYGFTDIANIVTEFRRRVGPDPSTLSTSTPFPPSTLTSSTSASALLPLPGVTQGLTRENQDVRDNFETIE